MRITDNKYYSRYFSLIGDQIDRLIESFDFTEKSTEQGYLTIVSAVYSSNIEGNTVDLNSFMNYKLGKNKVKPHREIKEIEDLISAYEYAQSNPLNEKNFLYCHKIFSETFLIKSKRGKYRDERIGVFDQHGLVYMAIEPELLKETMNIFFQDIEYLLNQNLTNSEVFYHASLIHLVFAHIHPFRDGNGRAARLAEKWFITQKLGKKFWNLPSEKYYKDHQQEYYRNINLGVNYHELDYEKCIPFLTMLPGLFSLE